MKNSKKIIIIAAALVLASVLALCGCMHLVFEPPVETKEYNPDEMRLPNVIVEALAAQSEMQKKYSAYGREEIGENGEKIFYLYTAEQHGVIHQEEQDKKERVISYEDLTYIINDSIRLYFEYDKIYFAEKVKIPGGTYKVMSVPWIADFNKGNESAPTTLSKASFIVPYHGDFSELNSGDVNDPTSAEYTYRKMLLQIYSLIYSRLNAHGFVYLFGYGFAGGEIEHYMAAFMDIPVVPNVFYKSWNDEIRDMTVALKNDEVPTNEHPIAIMSNPTFSEDLYIKIVNNGVCESVFPTKALIDLDPTK